MLGAERVQRTLIPNSVTPMSEIRTATIARKTNETDVHVALTLDVDPSAKQTISVNTGIGFLDHVQLLVLLVSRSLRLIGDVEDATCSCETWWDVLGNHLQG